MTPVSIDIGNPYGDDAHRFGARVSHWCVCGHEQHESKCTTCDCPRFSPRVLPAQSTSPES